MVGKFSRKCKISQNWVKIAKIEKGIFVSTLPESCSHWSESSTTSKSIHTWPMHIRMLSKTFCEKKCHLWSRKVRGSLAFSKKSFIFCSIFCTVFCTVQIWIKNNVARPDNPVISGSVTCFIWPNNVNANSFPLKENYNLFTTIIISKYTVHIYMREVPYDLQ